VRERTGQAARRPGAAWWGVMIAAALLLAAGLLSSCSAGGLLGPAATPTPTETPIPTETPGPSPTPDAVRPDDIVYIRRFIFGLSGDLYLVHPTGLAARQITAFTRDQASAASDYPVWTPDRKALIFASEYRDLYNLAIWNLYSIDPQGQGAQQITGLPQPNNGYFPSVQSDIPGVSVWAMMTAPPGVVVRGRVVANGKPVVGADVVSWLGRGAERTDADGNYTLKNVPPGQRGWIKALGEPGAGWTWVTPAPSGTTTAPDITLDPRLAGAQYAEPGPDRKGGLWSLYIQNWFDPATQDPRFETRLVHVAPGGAAVTDVYTAASKTLGRPRANPGHPEQIAIADGSDLLLLTTRLDPGAAQPVTERKVIRAGVLRNSPVAWSPDGAKLYYLIIGAQDAAYDSLQEQDMRTGATREVTLFRPDQQENSGFDISPDGAQVVYEEMGDLFTRPLDAPPSAKPRHITYYGQGSHPTWGGN
jgi:hypothetical protein